MKYYFRLMFALFGFYLTSCAEQESDVNHLTDSDFNISRQLHAKKISYINRVYLPHGMISVPEGLIIYDGGLQDSLFHYIKLDNNSITSDLVYGRKGRGDKEFEFPSDKVFSRWNDGYYIADKLSVRFYKSVPEAPQNPSYITKAITPKIGIWQAGVILGDSTFFGYSMGGSEKEFVLNKLGTDEVRWFGEYFDVPIPITSPSVATQVYPKMFTRNPASGKVAVFYYNTKRFKIFDVSQNFKSKDFVFTDQKEFSIKKVDNSNVDLSKAYTYYFKLHSSEKYIYALYYGERESEMVKDDSITAKVHVFDWDGNAIANFQLEDIYSTFCVAGDSIIYAASPMDIENMDAYKFRL